MPPLLISAVCVGGLYLPLPEYSSFGALAGKDAAEEFVTTLWQVTAGALALSVAAVIFAFQAIASSQSVTVRELWSSSQVLPTVYIGVGALLAQALALLGWGDIDAPAGWPGTWVTVLAFIVFGFVAGLFAQGMQLVNPAKLGLRRIRLIRRCVESEVETKVIERISRNYLANDAIESSYSFDEHAGLMLWDRRDMREVPNTAGAGIVSDINLRRLHRYNRHVKNCGLELTLTATVGRGLGDESTVAYVSPRHYRPLKGSARRIVRTRDRDDSTTRKLEAIITSLHEDALRAISTSSPSNLAVACEAYLELFLAYPEEWAKLGARYESSIAASNAPFGLNDIDRLKRNLYAEAEEAAARGSKEIQFDVTSLPVTIAIRALGIDAVALANDMVNLASQFFYIQPSEGGRASWQLALDNTELRIFEYIQYHLGSQIRDLERGDVDSRTINGYLDGALGAVAQVLKQAIDTREIKRFESLRRGWLQVLRFEVGEGAGRKSRRRGVTNALADLKSAWYLRLAMWAVHKAWQHPEDDMLGSVAATLLRDFKDHRSFFRMIEAAFEHKDSTVGHWQLSERPPGEAYVVDSNLVIYRTLALWLLLNFSPGARLPEARWVHIWSSQIKTTFEAIVNSDQLLRSVGFERLPPQLSDEVAAAIDDASQGYEDRRLRALRTEELSDEKVDAFVRALKASWISNRDAYDLAARFDAVDQTGATPPPETLLGFGLQLLPKDWFVASEDIHGADNQAELCGRQLAVGEARAFRKALEELRQRQSDNCVFVNVAEAIEHLRHSHVTPRIVIAPSFGMIPITAGEKILELDLTAAPGAEELDGVPVHRSKALHGQLAIGDPKRSFVWREWPYDNGQLLVKIEQFSTDELAKTIDDNPHLFDDLEDRAARVDHLATHVKFEVYERMSVDALDETALAFVTFEVDPLDDFDELA